MSAVSIFWEALTVRRHREPAAPFVTWYGPGGTRAELSSVTFATAVAKTAGMLLEDLDAEPGDRIGLALPLHWQLPVWLAACDLTGLVVVWPQEVSAQSQPPSSFEVDPVDITVVPQPADRLATTVVVSATTPFGVPEVPVPDAMIDHFRAALGQPDDYSGPVAAGSWSVAGQPWHGERIEADGTALAQRVGLEQGGRLLLPPGTDPVEAALGCWAVPLLTGGSVVLVQEGDTADIAARERVTAHLTATR